MLGQRYLDDGKSVVYLNHQQIEAKRRIENKGYPIENYECECGATEEAFEILAEKDRYGLKSRTVICRKCGLVMTNPRMTQEAYDDYYNTEYAKLYRNQLIPDEEYFEERIERGKVIYDYIVGEVDNKFNAVLEIGCAAGAILYYFKQRGCKVTGVDLGNDYIEFGKKKGLNLYQCHSSELLREKKKYDLIIVNHVAEHFLNIESELNVIQQLLDKDGILYIEVPGIKNLVNSYEGDFLRYLQNAHVYDFTLGTLEQVMKKYGFELVVGDEVVRSVWKYTGKREQIIKNYFYDNLSFLAQLEGARVEREKNIFAKLKENLQYLIIDITGYVNELKETKNMNTSWLKQILSRLNETLQIIDLVVAQINEEKTVIDEETINQNIDVLNNAIMECNIDKLQDSLDKMKDVFQAVEKTIENK